MMNPEDALRALEEQQIAKDIIRGAQARSETREIKSDAAVFRRMSAKIDELRQLRAEEIKKTEAAIQQVNAAVAFGNSAVLALKDATEEIAFLKNVPLEAIQKPINISRTRHFNKIVNAALERKSLTTDPRISEDMKQYPWYVPGLDPERGV